MVNEQKDGRFLDVVISICRPAGSCEAPLLVADGKFNKFVGNGTAMDLTNTVDRACIE